MTTLLQLVLSTLISSLFLWAATALVGIDRRSYKKALLTSAGCYIVVAMLAGLMQLLHMRSGGGQFLFVVTAIIGYLFVIRSVFQTSWGKAAAAWLVQIVLTLIVSVPIALLVVGAAVLSNI